MGPQHPEAPGRIGAIHDMLLIRGLLDFMQPYDAPLATETQLARAHSSQYLHSIAARSPASGSVQVDPDTSMNPYTYQAALRAAGAAVLATDLVLTRRAGFAFCNVRPPGHHAEHGAAGGFCFFNNAAVGIRHALDVHGLECVALIDFDVHHGNGSEDILRDDARVLMCSIFEDKLYPFCGNTSRGPNMVNVALPARSGGDAVRTAITEHWRGPVTYLDVGMNGTLSDLAHSRADLAVIALPNDEVAFALEVAGRIQCRAALVISAGVAPPLAKELHAIARKHGLHLLGPNCLGYQRPRLHLNASMAGRLAQPGSLALISQSGALTSAILDWADKNAVGFSTVVSLGPNTAVDLAQTLDFLVTDPATQSIVICMEGITNARRFLSALRGAANTKPVVVLKAGNAAAASQAAQTHSGAIVGSDEVFDAALRRTGAVSCMGSVLQTRSAN